jgi:hypothetical protein
MPLELVAVVVIAVLATAIGIRGRQPWGLRTSVFALLLSSTVYHGQNGSLVRRLIVEHAEGQSYAKGVIDMSWTFAPFALALLCNVVVLAGLVTVWTRASSREVDAPARGTRPT